MEIGSTCKFCIDNEHVVEVPALIPEIRRLNTAHGERVSIIGAYRKVIAVMAEHINDQDSSSTLKIRSGDVT